MNFNDFGFRNRGRGRGRSTRGKVNSVTVQKPLMPPPKNPAPRKRTTSSTTDTHSSLNVAWKNESSRSNVSTLVPTSTSFSTSDAESRVVIALSEGRGEAKHEVGIAAIDVSRPSLILCQISDSQSYINTLTKINILNPDEILIPMTFIRADKSNRLTEKIKEYFKHVLITAVPRSTFEKTSGMQYVRELCAPQWNSVIFLLQHRYYALAAASALFTYAEKVLYLLYARESLKIEYQESEGFAFIDIATADGLELVASTSPDAEKKFTSLLGVLNHCLTRIGGRMLRSSILQPPCSVPDIEARLDSVMELKRNPDLMVSVQSILSQLTNVDQLLSVTTILPSQEINFSERQMNYVLKLNVLLEIITPLKLALKNHRLPFLVDLMDILQCPTFTTIKNTVRDMIHSDAHPAKGQQGNFQRCFAIKSDVNGLLDLVRKAYSERIEEMREYVQGLGTKYNLPLSVSHNNKKGFHIILHLNQRQRYSFKKSDLSDEFIQVDRLATCVTMKTMELINWSTKIDMIQVEILKISNVMIYDLLLEIRQNIGLFYTLCEGIGKLDMLQSLAQASSTNHYVRPVFSEFLEVTNSRHPLLDFLCSMEPTPNTIFASDMHNVHVITGPNGSGKSIYIRQVLLLQVMAQVGSFVPAESATFRVCDRILARISFDDNIEFGVSTFALEIKEVEYFQTMMTKNTLIIIDELGRSTSVEEGTALAMAICEDFSRTGAFVFFTTHFNAITRLENLHLNITNWQLETYEETTSCGRKKLAYFYNLIPGVTSLKNYGLYCARASWPEEIVSYAEKLLKNVWQFKPSVAVFEAGPDERLKYDLEAELKITKLKKQLTVIKLYECLLLYVEKMNELGWNLNIEEFARDFPRSSNASDVPPPYLIQDTSNETNRNKNNMFLTPLNNYDAISQRSDIAFRFNESLQNSMYLIPEVAYSQSIGGEAAGQSYEAFKFGTPKEDYKVRSFTQQDYSNVATLNTSRNYNEIYNNSQSSSARATYLRFDEFENSKQHCSSEYFKNGGESQCSVTSNRRNNCLPIFRQAHDWTNLNDHQITSQNNFPLPLQKSNERASTPIQIESKFASFVQEGNSDSIPWKTVHRQEEFEESQSWETASEDLTNQHKPFSRNNSADSDVSNALKELESCSEYFSQDWEELQSQNHLVPTENKIRIHSMYVFDANNQLIQVVNPSKEIQTKIDQVIHNPKGTEEETEQEHQSFEALKRKYDDDVHSQQILNENKSRDDSQNECQESDGAQILSSERVSFPTDLTNGKTEEYSERQTEMPKVYAKSTENTQSYTVSGYLVRDQSSTYRKHLCRHSSLQTCNSKYVDNENQTKDKIVKGSGSLKTSNCVSEEVSQSRHLLGSYAKDRSIHDSVTVGYDENQTNGGLLSLRERGSQTGSYVKRQSSHDALKTNNSNSIDNQSETNEENVKTGCPFGTPNLGTLQEQGSQSRHLTGGNYIERQSSHNARELLPFKFNNLKRVDSQGKTNENNGNTRISNLETLQEQDLQLRHLSANHMKSQSPHNSNEFLSFKAVSSKRVDQRSQINEENAKRSCTPILKAIYSSECVDHASQTTEKNINSNGLINAPNLGTSVSGHSSHRRCRDSLPKCLDYESQANKERAKVNNTPNVKISREISQSRHLSGSYINEQGASLKTNNLNCVNLESLTDNGSAKASRFLNSIPHHSGFNSPKPSTKPLEISINSNDDVIETSQKNEGTQFLSALSSSSWFKRKRFDEEVLPRKTSSLKSSNREALSEKIAKEQKNVFASAFGISSLTEAKRARLSLTNPNEVVLDKKYEEVETFEDIGSCKPKSNANVFEDPIDDVSFDLSLDLFSDVTVTACTSVASSSDEFQKRAKFKVPIKKGKVKSKFVPPKILSKKEIQSDYIRQDLEMLNVKDETTLMKYHQQILNRPSVQQLQRQRHLAVLRNTGEGFEVIPTAPVAKRRRRKGVQLRKRESATNFDITLFSDKNSGKFEKFLEKKNSQSSSDGTKFRLQIEPTTTATKSFDNLFSRQNSDESNGEEAQGDLDNSISNIINKYLQDS